jgi:hypothetical protein
MLRKAPAVFLSVTIAAAVFLSARDEPRGPPPPAASTPDVVEEIDHLFAEQWAKAAAPASPHADELIVLRRLSLALFGQSPSLEEIRHFEADRGSDRIARWAAAMMNDARFHRYWAERLARAWVGTGQAMPIVYRRDRLVDWLADQLARRRPFDAVVRDVIAEDGTWTGDPATNYITSSVVNGKLDAPRLAGRTMRAIAGQRIECAQCHDDPFRPWTQKQFDGLAAFFTTARLSPMGVVEAPLERAAEVPYGSAWLPQAGTPRERLAAWLTDPRNDAFPRATANRVWALMYGRPLREPVDDVPGAGTEPVLDALGQDFVSHAYDLRRLILSAALSRPFGLAAAPRSDWSAFPVTALRPEQVVGSLLQASSVRSIDRDRHLLVRATRFLRESAFLEAYGDPGDDELAPQQDTVSRSLYRMNGKLAQDVLEHDGFATPARVAMLAPGDEAAVEGLWLSFLTRRPTDGERAKAKELLSGLSKDARRQALVDVAWGLFNAAEASWNH